MPPPSVALNEDVSHFPFVHIWSYSNPFVAQGEVGELPGLLYPTGRSIYGIIPGKWESPGSTRTNVYIFWLTPVVLQSDRRGPGEAARQRNIVVSPPRPFFILLVLILSFYLQRLRRELLIPYMLLVHENISPMFGFFWGDSPCMILPKHPNGALLQYLSDNPNLTIGEKLRLVREHVHLVLLLRALTLGKATRCRKGLQLPPHSTHTNPTWWRPPNRNLRQHRTQGRFSRCGHVCYFP